MNNILLRLFLEISKIEADEWLIWLYESELATMDR